MLDNAAVITLFSFAALIVAYFTYGRFIARRIYRLDPNRVTPAHELEDGVDYVPTRVPVLFGHHFASIAGLGPILGPAIAVIWGWLPAVLWVVIGSIFIGAVHDLGALTVSMRYKGRSVGDVCQNLMGPRARLLALLIIFFLMSLAMGAFVNAISALFVQFRPDAVIPSFGLMVVAMVIGVSVYKLKAPLGMATLLGLVAFAGLIVWGVEQPVRSYEWFVTPETRGALAEARAAAPEGDPEVRFESPYGAANAVEYLNAVGRTEAAADLTAAIAPSKDRPLAPAPLAWIAVLLVYSFVASVLPVWLLLQPRDYINSFQLYFALALLFIGLTVAALTGAPAGQIDAAAVAHDVPGAPPMIPVLFVTVACGAVSGFHSLVSSGTTVRQINKECDALLIGYGAMLTEGALAILVIMACVAGLGTAAWEPGGVYASWGSITGSLAAKLNAVVHGGAAFLEQVGMRPKYGRALLAVTIVAFAMTTLDSATRLLRFNVEEICRSVGLRRLANRYFASLVAVGGIAFFGLVPAGVTLWKLFGTTNQLLAGLTLLTVSLFLYKLGRPIRYTLIPMVIMLTMTTWAMVDSIPRFWNDPRLTPLNQTVLTGVALVVLAMSVWLVVEGMLSFARGRGGLDFDDDGIVDVTRDEAEAASRSQ